MGNEERPPSPSTSSSFVFPDRPPSTNGRRPPLAAANESRANPVHNRQGQESLENSLASLINKTFQSYPTSVSHSGTVDPSNISSPLTPSGSRNLSPEQDVEMDDLPSETEQSSTSEDENFGEIIFNIFLVFVI